MPDDVPGSAEMFRLLTRIDKRLDDMERRSAEREKDFVRVDVFEARQATDDVQLKALENEAHSIAKRLEAVDDKVSVKTRETNDRIDKIEDRRRADRALVLGSLAFPLLVAIIVAVLLTGRM